MNFQRGNGSRSLNRVVTRVRRLKNCENGAWKTGVLMVGLMSICPEMMNLFILRINVDALTIRTLIRQRLESTKR